MRLFLLALLVPHALAARRSHSTTFARRQGLLGDLLPGVLGSSASTPAPTTSILAPVSISPSSSAPVTTPTPTPTDSGGLLGGLTGPLGGLVSNVGGAVNTVGSGLGGAVNTIGGDVGNLINGPPSSTPTPSAPSPTDTPASSDPTPGAPSSTNPATSPTSSPDTATPTPPPSTPASSSDGGLLSGIVGGLTSVVGGVGSGVGGGLSTIASDVGSVLNPGPPPTSTPANIPSDSPAPTSDHIPPPPPPTDTPTSSPNGGIIGGLTSVVGGLTSDVGGIVSTVTSDLGGIGATPTSSPPGPIITTAPGTTGSNSGSSSGGLGGVINTLTSEVSGVVGSATSNLGGIITSATSDLGGIIPSATSDIGSVIATTTSGAIPTGSSGPSNSSNITSGTSVSATDSVNGPTSSAFSNGTSSAQPTISFPTQSSHVSITTTTVSQSQTSANAATTVTSTTVTTLSVASDLSFVLSESTLAFASAPTSTPATLTDPDQATTSIDPSAAQPATTLVAPPLPSGIPGWIYPREQLDQSSGALDGYVLISILFNNELNWMFEINDPISSSQLFVYMPMIIQGALGISSDQVKTFALRVYIPESYHGPSDQAQLGTLYLGYIPDHLVDTLAAQIKVKSSAFYTNGPDNKAKTLAQHVVSSYSLLSVSPDSNPGSGGSSKNSGDSNGSLDSGKSREEAIIGVVSALGAIAVLVLGFLLYRSYKRRQQLAHRRLSDPPGENLGVRPQGRQFDQDSVGGARRRSFYYAEDSLRGYESQAAHNDQLMAESSMSQRRNVVPSSISAPVLRGSTMNW